MLLDSAKDFYGDEAPHRIFIGEVVETIMR